MTALAALLIVRNLRSSQDSAEIVGGDQVHRKHHGGDREQEERDLEDRDQRRLGALSCDLHLVEMVRIGTESPAPAARGPSGCGWKRTRTECAERPR